MWAFRTILVWCVVAAGISAVANPVAAQDSAKNAIEQVLEQQTAAWNRGDVEGVMRGYENSPDTTFIGQTVQHGYQQILERYKAAYKTHDAMGTLEFSELEVRMLGPEHAVVNGKFHLARTAAGGGETSGRFSLVFEKTKEGWRIILDHTS